MEIYIKYLKKYWYYISLAIIAISISILFWYSNRDISSTLSNQVSHVVAQEQKPSCSLFIDVSGAVTNPNVYCLPEGSLIIDAIKKAGGFKKGLYAKEYIQSNINLAQKLESNQKLYIPFKNEFKYSKLKYDLVPVVDTIDVSKGGDSGNCISINIGSLEELDSLKGVGPSLAQKIIEGRPYKQVEDLNNISGIGDSLYSSIKDSVCL